MNSILIETATMYIIIDPKSFDVYLIGFTVNNQWTYREGYMNIEYESDWVKFDDLRKEK